MNKIRISLFIATILIITSSIFLYVFLDNNFLIRKWNLPLDPPGFKDSRQFTWASESAAMGYDPLVKNPANPIGQKLNYPRIWHLLFYLGLNESHTNLMGTTVLLVFFAGIGIFWFSKKYDNLTYLFLSILFLSPAVMLGIERSNIELLLFFVLAVALVINYSSSTKALFLFLFASILKLYPIFGILYLLKENKKKFWVLFLLAMSVFIAYLLFTFPDTMRVYATTPKLAGSSFGMNVWWMGLRNRRFFDIQMADNVVLMFRVLSYVMVFLVSAVALFFSLNNKDKNRFRQGEYLDAFRAGAAIYIGCFIVITNSDHRLIFLTFTIPQLVIWFYDRGRGFSLVPLITLLAILFSLWSTFIMRFWGRNPTFIMEEFSNWIILAGLLYFFFASVPEWVNDYLRKPFTLLKNFKIKPTFNR